MIPIMDAELFEIQNYDYADNNGIGKIECFVCVRINLSLIIKFVTFS